MALYTGKGDDGTTYLFDTPQGERIPKTSVVVEALGAVDELNSYLGICRALTVQDRETYESVHAIVFSLQEALFIIQAELAGAEKRIDPKKVDELGDIVNAVEKKLPPITTFFISGATLTSAYFDFARTLARRAERKINMVREEGAREIGIGTIAYLNRLSSVLYALARFSAHKEGAKENAPQYR